MQLAGVGSASQYGIACAGGSPSKLSRREQSGLEQTPSHARINTPLLNFGGSPGFGVSPLQIHHEAAIVMTPGSQTLLRSMAHNPIDKLDIAGDFATPLSTPGQPYKTNNLPGSEAAGAQTPSVLRHDTQAPVQTATPSRNSVAMAMKPPAAPPTQRSLVFEGPADDAEDDSKANVMQELGSHVAECQFVSPVKGPRPPGANAAKAREDGPVLSAPNCTPPMSVLRPQTPCKQSKHGAGEGPGRVMSGPRGLAVKIDQDADMPELAFHGPRLGAQALEPVIDDRHDQMTANLPQDENEQMCEVNAGTASNSSTCKSSGISSLDAIERTASRQNAADLKRSQVAGAKQGEGTGCDPGGSRVIRTQLDSMLDDVFSF